MNEWLPPATASLWQRLEEDPALGGFHLLGESALALRIGHRQSEDLDFAWPGMKLPRERLDTLIRKLENEGWVLERDDSDASYDEFLIAGMDLHDYQQNFVAYSRDGGSVKLTFFVPSSLVELLLKPSDSPVVVLPDLDFLFKTKALVTAERSASRDWLDLYILMTRHGFTMDDYASTFRELEKNRELDRGLRCLESGQPRNNDPGYRTLAPDAPEVTEVTEYFRREIKQWELEEATRRLGEANGSG